MNGIDNPIVFYPVATLLIVFAGLTIYFKNIFYSLLSAIAVFFITALFFYVLGSEYNAVIQVAIYGLAIPVVLGVAIMFTSNEQKEKEVDRNKTRTFLNIILFIGGIFILTLIYIFLISFLIVPEGFNFSDSLIINPKTSINLFRNGIFKDYVFAFEVISLILTIIVAGLTMFKKEGKLK